MGPVASQEAIKMLGTNGGGFFNANSAHPYENPTPFSNFVQMLLDPDHPGRALSRVRPHDRRRAAGRGRAHRDGDRVHRRRIHGRDRAPGKPGSPMFASLQSDQAATALQPGGNMEGKETRFGIAQSALFFTVATTAASCGAVERHARLAHAARRPGAAAAACSWAR